MRIILVQNFNKLGLVGDVINVKNGYGRNFLISKNYAIPATEINLKQLDKIKSENETKAKITYDLLQKSVDVLDGKFITFIKMSSDDGVLYGSIKNKDIVNELNKMLEKSNIKFKIDTHHLSSVNPIKSLGVYKININFSNNISSLIIINVARTELEGKINIEKFNNEANAMAS